jgi:hypothetical protein
MAVAVLELEMLLRLRQELQTQAAVEAVVVESMAAE